VAPKPLASNAALIEAMSISLGKELRITEGSRLSARSQALTTSTPPMLHRTAGTMMVLHSLSADLMGIKRTLRELDIRFCALADTELPAAEPLRFMFKREHRAPLLARRSTGRADRRTSLARSHVGLALFGHLALLLSQWRERPVPVLIDTDQERERQCRPMDTNP
jgi:hypothetical protein